MSIPKVPPPPPASLARSPSRQSVKVPALLAFHKRIYERTFSAVRAAVGL